ncbi:MAG: amino acid adenylation domain-containing protein, partial [bacterium]|nr:amino acid adenylation domain-containing protein [bacterium]
MAPAIRTYLAQNLPDYMIPSYFLKMEKLPLTPNGKIDRKALTQYPISNIQFQTKYPTHIAPRNETEEKLNAIWTDILGVQKHEIGIDDNFFDIGGHSLRATIMVSKIHKEFNVKLPLAEIFKKSSIRTLAETISEFNREKYIAIQPVEKKEYYNLSSAQKRLYILQQMEPESTAYNMPYTLPLLKDSDPVKLLEVFKKLIQRHESLRTSFHMIPVTPGGGQVTPGGGPITPDGAPVTPGEVIPVQKLHDEVEFEIEYYKPGAGGQEAKTFFRPFEMSKAPLLRVGIIETTQTGNAYQNRILMLDMHHIITDGTSQDLLIKEYHAMAAAESVSPLKLQYKDYAEWQNSEKQKKLIKQQEETWINQLSGELPILNLPTDYPRPIIQNFEGQTLSFMLNEEKSNNLKAIAKENEVTLYMTILSIFTIMLSKLSGQEDIIVGTPTAGRRHADLEKIIGMFVNTLAIRNYPEGGKTYKEYLRELKKNTLKAFENQDYQFENLVERLSVRRDTGRNPIFDVMFNLLNISSGKPAVKEPQASAPPVEPPQTYDVIDKISKFDLTLTSWEKGTPGGEIDKGTLELQFEYSVKLFKEETIKRYTAYFKKILQAVSAKPGGKIGEIEIITAEEKEMLLYRFNDTTTEYPKNKTLQQLFEEQTERTPDKISIIGGTHETPMQLSVQLTHRELNERAKHLAALLQNKGHGPGSIAGIKTERTVEMMTGILAIFKAGGAYLPIDPDYPPERIRYMLADSNAGLLLTDAGMPTEKNDTSKVNGNSWEVENLDISTLSGQHSYEQFKIDKNRLFIPSEIDDQQGARLAYIIYTSGSTGKPKGVMIEHASLLNFIKGMTDIIEFKPEDCILSLTTISFDIFGLETLLPLTTQTKILIGSSAQQREPKAAGQIMEQEGVTLFQATPSRLQLLLSDEKTRAGLGRLKYLLLGGEALPLNLLEKARNIVPGKIYNVYGPTETTIWSTAKEVTGDSQLNIGKPITNTQIYILDRWDKLQPKGIAGELCIAGDGLARGYINKPELTAERFVKAGRQLAVGSRQKTKEKEIKKENEPEKGTSITTRANCPTNKSLWESRTLSSERVLAPGGSAQPRVAGPPEASLYRTGDLARWQPDGNIEYLGRIDQQVKVRGFRIELGEIETCLLTHPEIKETVVLIREAKDGDKTICAYYVVKSNPIPESGTPRRDEPREQPSAQQPLSGLKDYLSQYLPEYM